MKGKIEKIKGFWGDRAYRIYYDQERYGSEEANVRHLDIRPEDIDDFMDDLISSWMKINGIDVWRFENKKVITKQEEAEQDRDEREQLELKEENRKQMEKLLIEKFKTYNNPFPTDEALDFDVNVREKV